MYLTYIYGYLLFSTNLIQQDSFFPNATLNTFSLFLYSISISENSHFEISKILQILLQFLGSKVILGNGLRIGYQNGTKVYDFFSSLLLSFLTLMLDLHHKY